MKRAQVQAEAQACRDLGQARPRFDERRGIICRMLDYVFSEDLGA